MSQQGEEIATNRLVNKLRVVRSLFEPKVCDEVISSVEKGNRVSLGDCFDLLKDFVIPGINEKFYDNEGKYRNNKVIDSVRDEIDIPKVTQELEQEYEKLNSDDHFYYKGHKNLFIKNKLTKMMAEKAYKKYQHQLFDVFLEINNFIWDGFLSQSNNNLPHILYRNVLEELDIRKIGKFLYKMKKKIIKSKNVEQAKKYNQIVKNYFVNNCAFHVISMDKIKNLGFINFIDTETFEEYTDDIVGQNWVNRFRAKEGSGSGITLDSQLDREIIKLRNPENKNNKVCLEAIYGEIMSSEDFYAIDSMLDYVVNSSDEMDFDFSTIDENKLKSNQDIKKFYLGFREIYSDIQSNDFYIDRGEFGSADKREQYFMYLGSWIVPFFSNEFMKEQINQADFDTLCKILNKRIDFLLSSHYDRPKIEINQEQKNKLIIQTLIYASGSLCISESCNDKEVYKVLSMLTGEKKFVDGYKFNIKDIEMLMSCAEKSIVSQYNTYEFCKKHLAEGITPMDILILLRKLNIKLNRLGRGVSGKSVSLRDHRKLRTNVTGYGSNHYPLFDENDLKNHITKAPADKDKFDVWFSFFKTFPYFYHKRTGSPDEKKKIKSFFLQAITQIPSDYLSYDNFCYLCKYFLDAWNSYSGWEKIDISMNLTINELNYLMTKINKSAMNEKNLGKFKNDIIKYFRINDQKISDQDFENAYNNTSDVENLITITPDSNDEYINEIRNNKRNIELRNSNDDKSVSKPNIVNANINEIKNVENNNDIENLNEPAPNPADKDINNKIRNNDDKSVSKLNIVNANINEIKNVENNIGLGNYNNHDENVVDVFANKNEIKIIDINKIEYKNSLENQNEQSNEENQIRFDIEKEKNEFKEWASNKLKNNPLWYLIIWAFALWFNHKLETRLQNLSKKENLEPAPNVNDNQNQNKGEDRVPNMQPSFEETEKK